MSSSAKIAVCPGSYDPVTNGHLDIIGRASKVFDKVVIGVVGNAPRKTGHLFTPEERVRADRGRRLPTTGSTTSRCEIFRTLLVEFARECGAIAIVKGLRAISDFEYEFEMNQLNRKLADDIESVFILASPGYSFLRSSGVKEIADLRRRRLRPRPAGGGGGAARARRARASAARGDSAWAGACRNAPKSAFEQPFCARPRKLPRPPWTSWSSSTSSTI